MEKSEKVKRKMKSLSNHAQREAQKIVTSINRFFRGPQLEPQVGKTFITNSMEYVNRNYNTHEHSRSSCDVHKTTNRSV